MRRTVVTSLQWWLFVILLAVAFPIHGLMVEQFGRRSWWIVLLVFTVLFAVQLVLRIRTETDSEKSARRQVAAEQKRRRQFIAERMAEGMNDRQAQNAWFGKLLAEDTEARTRRYFGLPEEPKP
jgi:ABC-type transport system involved in cytochrome bd biosynthesis fused ATPase/permease subunit